MNPNDKAGGLDAFILLIEWGLITVGVFTVGVLLLYAVCRIMWGG